jgi:hypothetical protein
MPGHVQTVDLLSHVETRNFCHTRALLRSYRLFGGAIGLPAPGADLKEGKLSGTLSDNIDLTGCTIPVLRNHGVSSAS